MPIRPFSFLHASDLHLDRPPTGVEEVPEHLRPLFVDCAYRSAQRIFDAALAGPVDFVVLAGDVVDPDLAGPRGCVFLSEQAARLAAKNIRVYWAGGRADHADIWPPGLDLPANVHLFPRGQVGRFTHRRDNEPLAALVGLSRQDRKRIRPAEFVPEDDMPFTIAVCYGLAEGETLAGHGIHYWALGGEHERRNVGAAPLMAHYPGTPQGRRPREAGPRGCTSVQVDEQARVRQTFVSTDALRWLNERILVTPHTSRDQLERQLRERAAALWGAGLGPDALVHWSVAGSPWLAAKLRWSSLENDLLARLRNEFGSRRPALWSVAIEPHGDLEPPESWSEQESLLGEMLRSLKKLAASEEPPDLRVLLGERQSRGSLAGAAALDDPAERRRTFEDAALLAMDMLSHEESPK